MPSHGPTDVHDRRLRDQVFPPDWSNPRPAPRYNLVVLGGGTAGLVAAAGAAGLGARVALVERRLLGGDCLNFGCVPSKALLRAARAAAEVRSAPQFGVRTGGEAEVDFAAVMERLRRVRADLAPNDSAARFRQLGVDVFLGEGKFTSPSCIEVHGLELTFSRAVIATGARPSLPAIPGLESVSFLTAETLFDLRELPPRLVVLGAGPVGCEMAQAFARLGSRVTLIASKRGILPRDDPDAVRIIEAALIRDGVRVVSGRATSSLRQGPGGILLRLGSAEEHEEIEADRLLVAAGRTPNVDGLGLEAAGIQTDETGIRVDDFLRTSHRRVYACGDVCSRDRFTHAADFQARLVLRNALFHGRARVSELIVPRCTYTSPELAHVGHDPVSASAAGLSIDTFTQPFKHVDRALLDGCAEGFVRVHVKRGTDRIIGATVVGPHAGDLVGELTLALRANLGLGAIGSTIHPYPTLAEAIRRIGDLHARTRLTPRIQSWMNRWFRWQRGAG